MKIFIPSITISKVTSANPLFNSLAVTCHFNTIILKE